MSKFIPKSRTVTFDLRIPAQCSGAYIDLYAQWVVMVLSEGLKFSIQGQRNINAAINNLPLVRSPEETLTFGWTLEHALRNQGVHEGGYEHLALEVVLSDTFPERYATRVLYDMAAAYCGQADVVPHFNQLQNLVSSSNGVFTSADFGILVEDNIRICSHQDVSEAEVAETRRCPSPKELSLVLTALTQVAGEDPKRMTVIGGPVLGWLATVSEWLFGLHVAIYSATGTRLDSNDPNRETQILLVVNSGPGLQATIETWSQDAEHAKVVASRTHSGPQKSSNLLFGGRVIWQTLLQKTFGRSFQHLEREENKALGSAIGCAARTFQGFAEASGSTDSARSLGANLLKTISDWLPELRRVQGRMERQLKLSADDAHQGYNEHIQTLRNACDCGICSPPNKPISETDNRKSPYGFCLTVLTETIIALGLTLSKIIVTAQIYPTYLGVQKFYTNQVAKRREARSFDVNDPEHLKIIYGNEWNAPNPRRLQTCAEIFSGTTPTRDIPENLVGLAHEGICVYMANLEKSAGSRRTGDDGLIRVISGGICLRSKIFRRACLGPVVEADEFENVWEEISCGHLDQSLYCK